MVKKYNSNILFILLENDLVTKIITNNLILRYKLSVFQILI